MGIKLHNAGMVDYLDEPSNSVAEPPYDTEGHGVRERHRVAKRFLSSEIKDMKAMMKRFSSERWKALNDSMQDQVDFAEKVMDILGFEDD